MAKRTCDIDNCERVHRAKGLCAYHWKREYGKPTRYRITCDTCGTDHLHSRPDGRFCSDDCKGLAYMVERRTRSRELVGPLPSVPPDFCELPQRHPARRRPSAPHLWYMGSCAWCGDAVTDWQPATRYCSPRCTRRAAGSRRRKRLGYAKLELTQAQRTAIYDRDGWRCQLCLDPVDSDLMTSSPNDDWAPSLDHIITRASGGDDSPSNLRLAHRWCNSVRSDDRWHDVNALKPQAA